MNNTKENKAKLQITIALMALTVIFLEEMYLMINFKNSYFPIIILAVAALIAVYIIVNASITLNMEKEKKRNEHFENLYRSEKASYIMLKKSFDEIEEKLKLLQETSKVPAEEIINAQKGIAKVIISRSKENADAIINSNDQVLERLDEVEETQNTKLTSLTKEQKLKLTDIGMQTDMKLQDLLVQLKDTELRLNQAIMSGTKVVMQVPTAYAPVEVPVESHLEESIIQEEKSLVEEESLIPEEPIIEAEPIIEPEPIVEPEPETEELPPMPDLSDPNKQMSPDDIAALFANMAGTDAPAEEIAEETEIEAAEETEIEAEEDKPPMPDLSDPNKVMSPDEIAALIANM